MVHWSILTTAFGIGMLIPGPFDVFFGGLGVLVFKHPIGFVIGVGLYNLAGASVVAIGLSGVLDEVGHKSDLEIQSLESSSMAVGGFCDPDDPPWWC